MNIHIAIRQIRERKGLSQDKLATLADLDRTYISMLERGTRIPSLTTLQKVAKAFDMKVWVILKLVEEQQCD